MTTNRKSVFALALIAIASACGRVHSPCGADGDFVALSDADYCVYTARPHPIVIEGGFSCPGSLPFEAELDTHWICSDRPIDVERLRETLCAERPAVCTVRPPPTMPTTPVTPPVTPPVRTPPPAIEPESADAGVAEDGEPSGPRWTEDCFAAGGVLDYGLTGDRCDFTGCGSGLGCGLTTADCRSGVTLVSELTAMDCPSLPTQPSGEPPTWGGVEACEAALDEGHSLQTCQGPFICARRTRDACCLEYAFCDDRSDRSTPNLLYRYRLCERGCSQVEPSAEAEPVTDCSYFAGEVDGSHPDEYWRVDLPCEGDFVCWGDRDLRSAGTNALAIEGGWLRWCSEGVVRGQHSTVTNLLYTSPMATAR